jgi:hypothetical protein
MRLLGRAAIKLVRSVYPRYHLVTVTAEGTDPGTALSSLPYT